MIGIDDRLDWEHQEHNKIIIYALVTMSQKLPLSATFSSSKLDNSNEVGTFTILAII